MKIIGSILIIISSIIASYFYEKRLKHQLYQLKEIDQFTIFIKTQIEYFSLSLNEIYTKFNSKSEIIDKLISKKELNSFDEQIEDELFNTFRTLGNGFKEEQIKKLEYLHTFLDKKINEIEENYAQKTKVFRAMSIFIGCCTVILLV